MHLAPPTHHTCDVEQHSAKGRDGPVPERGVRDGQSVGDVELWDHSHMTSANFRIG